MYLVPENALQSYMRHVSALPTAPGSAHISPAYTYQDGPARKGSPRASKDGPTGAGEIGVLGFCGKGGMLLPVSCRVKGDPSSRVARHVSKQEANKNPLAVLGNS